MFLVHLNTHSRYYTWPRISSRRAGYSQMMTTNLLLCNDTPDFLILHTSPHFGSLHPIGIKAAAILLTPLSVARRLNCAAAFRVSCISTLIPNELIYFLVSGEMGYIDGPSPKMSMSVPPSTFYPFTSHPS